MMDEKSYEMLEVLFKIEKGLGFEEWLKKIKNNTTIGKDAFISRKKELEKEEFIILKKGKYCITIRDEYWPVYRDFCKKMHIAEKVATKFNKVTRKEAFFPAYTLILLLWYHHNRFSFPLVYSISLPRGDDMIFSISKDWIDSLIHKIILDFNQRDQNYCRLLIKNIEKRMFPIDRIQLSNL